MKKIDRKIYFYRLVVGEDVSGRAKPFNPIKTLNYIDKLPWTSKGRYWIADDGKITCCWVDKKVSPYRIRIGNIRRSDLPQIEEGGTLSPLVISRRSGLVEQVHLVFFDKNIVGMDFNFYGPRISRFSYYLAEKAQGIEPSNIYFEPLIRQDVYQQLTKLKFLRLFQLKVRASYAHIIAEANKSLGSAFTAAAQAGDTDDVEIILRSTKQSGGWLSNLILETTKKLSLDPVLMTESSRFIVEGYDEKEQEMVKLDLLNDKLIVKKSILRQDPRTRALDSTSAYTAIESAYKELRDQLVMAGSIRI